MLHRARRLRLRRAQRGCRLHRCITHRRCRRRRRQPRVEHHLRAELHRWWRRWRRRQSLRHQLDRLPADRSHQHHRDHRDRDHAGGEGHRQHVGLPGRGHARQHRRLRGRPGHTTTGQRQRRVHRERRNPEPPAREGDARRHQAGQPHRVRVLLEPARRLGGCGAAVQHQLQRRCWLPGPPGLRTDVHGGHSAGRLAAVGHARREVVGQQHLAGRLQRPLWAGKPVHLVAGAHQLAECTDQPEPFVRRRPVQARCRPCVVHWQRRPPDDRRRRRLRQHHRHQLRLREHPAVHHHLLRRHCHRQ